MQMHNAGEIGWSMCCDVRVPLSHRAGCASTEPTHCAVPRSQDQICSSSSSSRNTTVNAAWTGISKSVYAQLFVSNASVLRRSLARDTVHALKLAVLYSTRAISNIANTAALPCQSTSCTIRISTQVARKKMMLEHEKTAVITSPQFGTTVTNYFPRYVRPHHKQLPTADAPLQQVPDFETPAGSPLCRRRCDISILRRFL